MLSLLGQMSIVVVYVICIYLQHPLLHCRGWHCCCCWGHLPVLVWWSALQHDLQSDITSQHTASAASISVSDDGWYLVDSWYQPRNVRSLLSRSERKITCWGWAELSKQLQQRETMWQCWQISGGARLTQQWPWPLHCPHIDRSPMIVNNHSSQLI